MSFDHTKLLEVAGEDQELIMELIGIFREQCPEYLANIEQAVIEKQPQQLRKAAHTLKGSLGSMGADAAYDLALALETMGISEELEQAETAFERLKHQLDQLIQDLVDYEGAPVE